MAAGLWMVIMGLIFFYFVYLFKRFILGKSKDEIQLEDLEKEEMELITSNSIFKSKAKKEKQLKELRDKIELLNNKVNQHKNTDTSLTKAVYNHSKDVVSEIKPKINEYKEKYSSSNQINNIDILNEDELYEKIMIEIEEDKKVKSTWARALAQSDGDKNKAESLYIKLRVQNMKEEQAREIESQKEQEKQAKLAKVGGKELNKQEKDFLSNYGVDLFSSNVDIDFNSIIINTPSGKKEYKRS